MVLKRSGCKKISSRKKVQSRKKKVSERLLGKIKGFGIIEFVVVTAIVGMIGVTTIAVINPSKLINQAKDARKKADLNRIQLALEDYNNDHNGYATLIPFGLEWKEGNVTYLSQTPQDPNYPADSYHYITDGSTHPQWYVLFAKLKTHTSSVPACNLPSSCLPVNYNPSWDCVVTGKYQCSVIVAQVLPASPTSASGIIASLTSLFTGSSSVSTGKSSPQLLTPTPTTIYGLPPETGNSKYLQANDGTYCYDSDGTSTSTNGKTSEYRTQGFCIDKAGIHYDYCSNDLARSYYCSMSFGSSGTSKASCDLGGYYCTDNNVSLSPVCVSGACTMTSMPTPQNASQLPATNTLSGSDGTYCFDSDGNGNAEVAGSCQDNTGIYYDFCPTSKTLVDYYCSGKWNGQAYTEAKCSGGASPCYGSFDIHTGIEDTCKSGVCFIPGSLSGSSTGQSGSTAP